MNSTQSTPPRRRNRYGLEVRILKQTPLAFLMSGLCVFLTTQLAHWMAAADTTPEGLKHTHMIDIVAISVLITLWTAIFTVAIGAFVVYVMKGPAYTADSLELIDSERPPRDNPKSNDD